MRGRNAWLLEISIGLLIEMGASNTQLHQMLARINYFQVNEKGFKFGDYDQPTLSGAAASTKYTYGQRLKAQVKHSIFKKQYDLKISRGIFKTKQEIPRCNGITVVEDSLRT